MEQNNIEKQIQEKLNQRQIQPSLQAWDRLDAMLSVQEEKKEKKSFSWLKIAAGFILFVGLGFLFFVSNENNSLPNSNDSKVVEHSSTSKLKAPLQEKETVVLTTTIEEKIESQASTSEAAYPKEGNSKQNNNKKNSNWNQEPNLTTAVANVEVVAKENETKSVATPLVKEIQEIVAIQKNDSKAKLKINPNALLDQVEEEEVLTFRQKVMKSINKNFKNAKESFASRNQE